MRKEYVNFPSDIPVTISYVNIKNYPLHWHDAIEILYVLKGSIKVDIDTDSYEIQEDEIEIVNTEQTHRIYSNKDNRVLIFKIDPHFFEKYYSDIENMFFYTNTSDEVGGDLKEATLDMLGEAESVKVTKESTTIVNGRGNSEEIKNRVNQIKLQLEATTSEFDKEKLQERLAKLAGGVAVVKVGAATETELKESKLRIEDALAATKAAVEEGIVPGGGTAYVNVINEVAKLTSDIQDEQVGINIIVRSLEEPMRQIAHNAGLEGSVIIEKVKNSDAGVGFDALRGEYKDMIKAGIVDPTKVTRSALQNAASVASTFLTTEAAVADIPEKEMPQGAGMGMDGMY